MEKYQIVEVTETFNHAGTKATADISFVADRLGFKRLDVKMDTYEESVIGKGRRQIGYFRDWRGVEKTITKGSVVLLQHPFHHNQLTREKTLRKLKEKYEIKAISVVHDVEELRAFRFSNYYAREFQTMIELADVIIVHNRAMKDWFIKQGVGADKLIALEIFDYIQSDDSEKPIQYEKSITIAGNLDTTKCTYIAHLGEMDGVKVHLYGPNFDERLKAAENVEYHGSYPVNEIPSKLNRGFGLVWDGESIDGCKGLSGQYLRYNNPHKLSLYLSSGLPVIIWREAAEAEFVENNNVGILVDSLNDIERVWNDCDEKKYGILKNNVVKVAKRLKTGFYTEEALKKAIAIVCANH